MTSKRCSAVIGPLVLASVLFPAIARSARAEGVIVCGCLKLSDRIVGPGVVESTYRAKLINFGPALPGATATIDRHAWNIEVLDGAVSFGPVGSWRAVWSSDTFTIRRSPPFFFDCLLLRWSVVPANGNRPPVANAGPDRTARVGSTVTLDGSASSDVDGDALTFAWGFESVPSGSQARLADPAAVNPSLVLDLRGTYVVRLIVNDGAVDSEPDTVVISTENSPPVADAGPDQTVRIGATAALDGSGSTDVDGDALTHAWSFVSVPPGSTAALSDPTAVAPTFAVDRPGTYEVQLLVSDGASLSAPDTVTITTENSPPVANAGPDQTVVAGQPVALSGAGSSDPDGDPLSFAWSLTTRPAGSNAALAGAATITPSFIADLPGTYVVQLIVNDGQAVSAPDTVTIATTNIAPVANAGPDRAGVPVGTTVTVDGSGSSDADGHPLTFAWSLLSRPAGSATALDDPTSTSPVFVADLAGEYVAQLIVNDGFADSAPDTVRISAVAPVIVSVAATDDRAAENGLDPGTFTLTRTGPATDPLTVAFALTGSATNGTDYAAIGTSATIPAGSSTATVAVTPIADIEVEGTESVVLALSAGAGYTIGAPGLASVAITDSIVVTVTATDPDASELGPDPGVFTFARAGGDQSLPLTLTFSRDGTASNAADYANIGFTVTIPANQASVAVTIAPQPDNELEGPETVLLTINPSLAYTVGAPGGPVTIADDPVVVNIAASDPDALEAGADPAVFTFTRAGGNVAAPLTVFYTLAGTAANNSDYLFIGNTVVIPGGQVSATLTITPRADNRVEGAETVIVTLEPRPAYSIGASHAATATIADDPPVLTIVATDPDASETGPDPGVFTLTRTGGDPGAAIVAIISRGGTASNGTDYVSIGGGNFAVTIPANQSSATITIVPIADPAAEGPETVVLTINPSPNFVIGTPGSATVTIVDGP